MPELGEEFLQLRTIKSWGLYPALWRKQSADDRALMLAYDLFENTRDSYRDWWRRRKDKDKGKVNPYKVMKTQMGID